MSRMMQSSSPRASTWPSRSVTLADGTLITVLLMPGSEAGVTYVLPTAPRLVRGAAGEPSFSLHLVLSHAPGPDQENVHPLITRGLLRVDVQMGVDPAVLDVLADGEAGEFRRLFARQIDYCLLWQECDDASPRILARAEGSGTEGRAGLSAGLDRSETLDVLGSLDGSPSRLRLCAMIHYRAPASPQVVQLSGSWAAIHDFLSAHQDEHGRLTESDLQDLIPALASQGLLSVTRGDGDTIQLPAETLVSLFMRQAVIVLHREVQPDSGDEVWYTLRPRPHESFRLNYSQSIEASQIDTYEVFAPLEHILGSALKGRDWDDYVHLVAEESDNLGRVATIPRRVRTARGQRADQAGNSSLRMAATGNRLTSLALATRPSLVSPTTRPLLTSANFQSTALTHLMLDDMRIELPQQDKPRSLPVIDDPNAPYWRDRLSSKKFWYAPGFEVVEPAPDTHASGSPFLFSFERVGVTNTGQPALRGEVRLTLRAVMSEKTAQALRRDGRQVASAVVLEAVSVFLLVPFVDTVDGRVKQHNFEATVTGDGDTLTASVPLLNEWVRLCYGALAVDGFQTVPAQVRVAYTFTGYVAVKEQDLELAFGGKALHTPVLYSAAEVASLRGTTYFDAATLTYVQPRAEVRYQRESGSETPAEVRRARAARLARPELNTSQPIIATTAVVHPELTIAPDVSSLLRKIEYATRTQVRKQTHPVLFPCNRLGRLYQEVRDRTPMTVGCQDALTLGQTRYRQYEEITELRDPAYQVYRSLQQPGHFLVVPASFCISRRAAGEPDAYRPLVFLHALLDAEVAANNRVELRATLQPDLLLFERRALQEQLKAYDPAPMLYYPTDIPSQAITVNWALDPAIAAASETDTFDASGPFISTYFRMDLPSWQLMRRVLDSPGISGSISFTLDDGSQLSAGLLLKLDHIRGPWESGPLEVTSGGGHVHLTNHIERTVDVSDLVRYAGPRVSEQVPVEVSLPPEGTHTVKAEGELQPVYSYPPGDPLAITEVRSFVEDIYTNLIFINLLNFSNYNLIRLDVEARVRNVEGQYTAQLSADMPVADIPILLPLTTYLEQHVLEFRVTKIFNDREAQISDWMQWDLDTSVPISLTHELLGL